MIGDIESSLMTRRIHKGDTYLLCEFEPKSIKDALENEDWIQAMNKDIDQIEMNSTWNLVPSHKDKNVIGTKWVFRNKLNENGEVTRNKERQVCKGYAQEEGFDYRLYYKRSDRFVLKVFTHSDWAGNIDDRKITSGGAFFLEKRLVSWTKKK